MRFSTVAPVINFHIQITIADYTPLILGGILARLTSTLRFSLVRLVPMPKTWAGSARDYASSQAHPHEETRGDTRQRFSHSTTFAAITFAARKHVRAAGKCWQIFISLKHRVNLPRKDEHGGLATRISLRHAFLLHIPASL